MRTDELLEQIVDRLHYNCGDLHEAARYCGVSPAFLFTWIKEDSQAADTFKEAQRVGYAGLESEAIRRAVVGDAKGVYYKGEQVGTEYVKSDGLLTKLLEARVPEYRKGEQGGNTYIGQQVNLMPRAENYEQWLTMRDATLARREDGEVSDAAKAAHLLMAPPIEAEYEIIPTEDRPLAHLKDLL